MVITVRDQDVHEGHDHGLVPSTRSTRLGEVMSEIKNDDEGRIEREQSERFEQIVSEQDRIEPECNGQAI